MILSNKSKYFQYLNDDELNDPYRICCEFMDFFDLPYARKLISRWMRSLYKGDALPEGMAGEVLCMYERLCQLIEAAWLIDERDNSARLANISSERRSGAPGLMDTHLYCLPKREEDAWKYFPRSLTRKEYIDPYKVFEKMYCYRSLNEWKTTLHTMLHLAMHEHSMEDTDDHFNIITVKTHLDKLLDASQLISVREFYSEDGKFILKARDFGKAE